MRRLHFRRYYQEKKKLELDTNGNIKAYTKFEDEFALTVWDHVTKKKQGDNECQELADLLSVVIDVKQVRKQWENVPFCADLWRFMLKKDVKGKMMDKVAPDISSRDQYIRNIILNIDKYGPSLYRHNRGRCAVAGSVSERQTPHAGLSKPPLEKLKDIFAKNGFSLSYFDRIIYKRVKIRKILKVRIKRNSDEHISYQWKKVKAPFIAGASKTMIYWCSLIYDYQGRLGSEMILDKDLVALKNRLLLQVIASHILFAVHSFNDLFVPVDYFNGVLCSSEKNCTNKLLDKVKPIIKGW